VNVTNFKPPREYKLQPENSNKGRVNQNAGGAMSHQAVTSGITGLAEIESINPLAIASCAENTV
jgi:protein tyrosine phosphatase (PTP) superfamily phosphohydrolase (DUF442 family)